MVTYGQTVPKNVITAFSVTDFFSMPNKWVYLMNVEIKKSGYLKKLEIYVNKAGWVSVQVRKNNKNKYFMYL